MPQTWNPPVEVSQTMVQQAADRMNIRPIDAPLTHDRTLRARKFASQIMGIIGEHCSDKTAAYYALVAAAYDADAEIVARAHEQRDSDD